MPPAEAAARRQCRALKSRHQSRATSSCEIACSVDCAIWSLRSRNRTRPQADHGGHANLDPGKYCHDETKDPPRCEDYCRTVSRACSDGKYAVFEDERQCRLYCDEVAKSDQSKLGFNRDGWYI